MADSKIVRPDRLDTYREWQEAQGIPLVEGFFIGAYEAWKTGKL